MHAQPLTPSHLHTFTYPRLIMYIIHKSRLAKIFLLALFVTLLFLIPFISTSMRSSYYYFLLNLLIVVLGADAGFLSAMSKTGGEKKLQASVVVVLSVPMIMEKPIPAATYVEMEKKTSIPSLFFIGSCESEEEEEEAAVDEINGELMSKQLCMKAEMFIANFYKQLKMQRENSWQKLHMGSVRLSN